MILFSTYVSQDLIGYFPVFVYSVKVSEEWVVSCLSALSPANVISVMDCCASYAHIHLLFPLWVGQ